MRWTKERYGDPLYGKYGFIDCFNPTFTFTGVKLQHGQLIDGKGKGWFDADYLGIDQGSILTMIENIAANSSGTSCAGIRISSAA
ncbi:MAG: hypothetical protein O3C21_08065 [Verrucomicrobia bacterium]|nr:hypothetical protein [Verrucomicrobiota bacterium]